MSFTMQHLARLLLCVAPFLLLVDAPGPLLLAQSDAPDTGAPRPPAKADPTPDSGTKKPQKSRLVAIGDIHGDFRRFHKLLGDVGLIDEKDHWKGGKQHLIQTGDIVDRGPDSLQAIQLLTRLEKEASAAGGKVTVLLGNHEIMNLTGDMTYVSAGEIAAFAKEETAEFRAARRERIFSLLTNKSELLRSSFYPLLSRHLTARNFDRLFPRGRFAHRRAFSPRGRIGKWLLKRPFLTKVDGSLFVHAGISPRHAHFSSDEINKRMKDELRMFLDTVDELSKKNVFDADLGFSELFLLIASEKRAGGPHPSIKPLFARLEKLNKEGLLFASDGPIWYRGLAENNEQAFQHEVDRILELQSIERIVIGHTQPRTLRVEGRFRNSVILIDTGMNREFYGGRPSALLFQPSGSIQVLE